MFVWRSRSASAFKFRESANHQPHPNLYPLAGDDRHLTLLKRGCANFGVGLELKGQENLSGTPSKWEQNRHCRLRKGLTDSLIGLAGPPKQARKTLKDSLKRDPSGRDGLPERPH